jgi:hypothetical protein
MGMPILRYFLFRPFQYLPELIEGFFGAAGLLEQFIQVIGVLGRSLGQFGAGFEQAKGFTLDNVIGLTYTR